MNGYPQVPVSTALLLLAAVTISQTARAQTGEGDVPATSGTIDLTLDGAHLRALAQNPDYEAARHGVAAAAGRLRQAETYPYNPELEFAAPGFADRGELSEYEVALRQVVEWAGQRGLRRQAARLDLSAAESAALDAARKTLAEVSNAFYSALAFEQRLQVAREMFELSDELVAITRIQAREGEISVMEANLAEIEAGRSRSAVRSAERELRSSMLELRRLLGIRPERPIRLVDEIPDVPAPATLSVDSLMSLAMSRRPDLAAQRRRVERRSVQASLAGREALPNFQISIFLEREEGTEARFDDGAFSGIAHRLEGPRVGVGVSVPVAIFQRNRGLAAARRAEADQEVAKARSIELRIRKEVVDARQTYRAAREEHRIFENDVLEPARANQRLLETAFREGKVALPTLLLLRNQLLEAELSHWDSWLVERRALVALGAATATFSENLIPAVEVER